MNVELAEQNIELLTVECECGQLRDCDRCIIIIGSSLTGRRPRALEELLELLPPEWALINDYGPEEDWRDTNGEWIKAPSYVCDILVGEGQAMTRAPAIFARGATAWDAVAGLLVRLEAENRSERKDK